MHKRRKKPKRNHSSVLDDQSKILVGFKAEKIVPKNWKRNQRSYTSLLSLILPCSVVNNQGKNTQ